jgi:hypothetical protein
MQDVRSAKAWLPVQATVQVQMQAVRSAQCRGFMVHGEFGGFVCLCVYSTQLVQQLQQRQTAERASARC